MNQIKSLIFISILILVSNISFSAENRTTTKGIGALDNISIGVIISGNKPEEEFKRIKDLGFSYCQLSVSCHCCLP